jgi:hypothetical protein
MSLYSRIVKQLRNSRHVLLYSAQKKKSLNFAPLNTRLPNYAQEQLWDSHSFELERENSGKKLYRRV